jgi:hypothetical protein
MTHQPTHPRAQALRRSLASALAGVALVTLSACGGSATATPITPTSTTAAAAAPTQTTVASPVTSGSAPTATRPAATTGVASPSAPAATVAPTTAAASSVSGASAPAATAQKVNVNTASQVELLQAFQTAGIPNAARWVTEVMEYRPYPTNDPTFAKLRAELAKYNPSPDVVDKIIATLGL